MRGVECVYIDFMAKQEKNIDPRHGGASKIVVIGIIIFIGVISYFILVKSISKNYTTYAECIEKTELPCKHYFVGDLGHEWRPSPYRSKEECDNIEHVVGFTCIIPPGNFRENRWINASDLRRAEREKTASNLNPTSTQTKTPVSTPIYKPTIQLLPWDSNKIYFYYNENNYKDELKFLRLSVNGEPVFQSSYEGGELILGDKFYLKLKDKVTLQDLQKLNQKYNVILEEEQYGFYIISVKNNSQTNALEVANAYHDELIIQWAMPLWGKKRVTR